MMRRHLQYTEPRVWRTARPSSLDFRGFQNRSTWSSMPMLMLMLLPLLMRLPVDASTTTLYRFCFARALQVDVYVFIASHASSLEPCSNVFNIEGQPCVTRRGRRHSARRKIEYLNNRHASGAAHDWPSCAVARHPACAVPQSAHDQLRR